MKRWYWVVAFLILGIVLYFETSDTTDDSTTLATDNDDDGQDDASDGENTVQSFLSRWAHAIAPAENVNPAYNNPGGLNMVGDEGSTPAAGGTGHDIIGIFSSLEAGYQALENVLAHYLSKYSDLTLLQVTAIYQLGPGNSAVVDGMTTGNFPQSVVTEASVWAKNLGVSINDRLGDIAAQ